jgi:hypothetical protein
LTIGALAAAFFIGTLAIGAILATLALFGGIEALLGAFATTLGIKPFGARFNFLSNYEAKSLAPFVLVPAPWTYFIPPKAYF